MPTRQFERSDLKAFCLIESEQKILRSVFVNYSQMGGLLRLDGPLAIKKHIAMTYSNEKSQFVKIAAYTIRAYEKNGFFYVGVKFIAIISR